MAKTPMAATARPSASAITIEVESRECVSSLSPLPKALEKRMPMPAPSPEQMERKSETIEVVDPTEAIASVAEKKERTHRSID